MIVIIDLASVNFAQNWLWFNLKQSINSEASEVFKIAKDMILMRYREKQEKKLAKKPKICHGRKELTIEKRNLNLMLDWR